ncbi:Do family serine endopeptidase [Enterobacteriaceae endosymbiont of Plateumaris sericea]|uniref:Do family serine endopeptidase n=1 Tax=Enterobacteriaceae endosymbiont of Plateumaris sericea TaxID=2675797 RepID=UPI001449C493|nr:Do family serine endopeptidase [Enterobacteriaceae endosymbiont of Plateumaris sericea]QJC29940.1 Do family serine endopeptidase [Enterobacteriaceae endosymbiont of Plateumaris sericea]
MKKLKLIVYFIFCIIISTQSLVKIHAKSLPPHQLFDQKLPSLSKILDKAMPSVVSITVDGSNMINNFTLPPQLQELMGDHPEFCQEESIFRDTPLCPSGSDADANLETKFRSLASGVIIDAKNGYILTNNHVIENAKKIEVELNDGSYYEGFVIGSDPKIDVALIKINHAKNLVAFKIANSDKLKIGDYTIAIGNPFGLGNTVTTGIISGLGRGGVSTSTYENFIQTDAAMNRGNSGGALINLNGELIGLNTAILSPDGGNVGVGFAIPSNAVASLSHEIIKFGRIRHVYFGIVGIGINKTLANIMKAPTKNIKGGTFVSNVLKNSTAYNGGIKAGDIILAMNNKKFDSFYELRSRISVLSVGTKIKLTVIRNGKIKNIMLILQEDPDSLTSSQHYVGIEGAQLQDVVVVNKGSKRKQKSRTKRYVKVIDVTEDSRADDMGLEPDDIILDINKIPVHTIKDVKKITNKKPSIILIHILRENTNMYLLTKLSE